MLLFRTHYIHQNAILLARCIPVITGNQTFNMCSAQSRNRYNSRIVLRNYTACNSEIV